MSSKNTVFWLYRYMDICTYYICTWRVLATDVLLIHVKLYYYHEYTSHKSVHTKRTLRENTSLMARMQLTKTRKKK